MPHAAAGVAHVAGIPRDHEHVPGNTGNESKIAKQRSLTQTHSALGTFRNGEVTAGSMAGSVRAGRTTLVSG